jgi:CMP/dCMP kinase
VTIVAIDGPAGSGKSTLARLLAARLGYLHLDTGAMYRALTYLALRDGVALDDGASLAALARGADLRFEERGHVFAHEQDVSAEIRCPAVSAAVSQVSAHRDVRAVLVDEQRRIAGGHDVVMEGRDIGTVVFPDAAVKVFLVASADVRSERRRKELIAHGEHVSAEETLAAIEARDTYDSSRPVAPLRAADDAVQLDSSAMTIEGMVEAAAQIVRRRIGREP